MKIDVNYQQNKQLPDKKIEVTIESQTLSTDVQKLINTIENLDNHLMWLEWRPIISSVTRISCTSPNSSRALT